MDMKNFTSSSSVVNLQDFRQICRRATPTGTALEQVETGAASEQVSNPAHVQVLPFRKAAHVRHSKPQRIAHSAQRPATDDWHSRFALRLSQVRISLGVTEKEAAKAAGCSLRTWRRYEDTGKGRCTYHVGMFALHYDVSLDDLFDGIEEPAATGEFPLLPPESHSAIDAMIEESLADPIGRNERLRKARRKAWQRAEAKLEYWRAWRDLHSCIRKAHDYGVLSEMNCPDALVRMNDFEEPWKLDNYILGDVTFAERELMLTPAPSAAALDWKKRRAAHVWYRLQDGSLEDDIRQAIHQDEDWLDAHPARQRYSKRKPDGASH